MQIFRLVLIALLTGIIVINFWTINYSDLWSKDSLWAYVRMMLAIVFIISLVKALRFKHKKIQ